MYEEAQLEMADIAALVMELDFYTFPLDERGQRAARLRRLFEEWVDASLGDEWRKRLWHER